MKFNKYLQSHLFEEWRYFYVDYKHLKQIIKMNKSHKFIPLVEKELKKVNAFFNLIKKYENTHEHLDNFVLLNYMALFKSMKKYDKKMCKTIKMNFFKMMQEQDFYKYYIQRPRRQDSIKMVIFDKDGTLVDHTSLFGPWVKRLIENMEDLIPLKTPSIWEHLGYNPSKGSFKGDSLVAKGTNDDIRNGIAEYIVGEGIPSDDLRKKIMDRWIHHDFELEDIVQCADVKNVFQILIDKGIKVCVCTSDDRKPTEKTMKILGVDGLISMCLCGDDENSSKPSPEPIWKLCSEFNIKPSETIMVGDTMADIQAGLNARCAFSVGVLSGGYVQTDLDKADLVINNIGELISSLYL